MSIEALAMRGVDYRNVEAVVMDRPWHLLMDETFNGQKEDEKLVENACWKSETEDRRLCPGNDLKRVSGLSDACRHDQAFDRITVEDSADCMKQKLREWARAVAIYIRFLDEAFAYPSPEIT
eukprot:Gb_25694 [translate_table: standard]